MRFLLLLGLLMLLAPVSRSHAQLEGAGFPPPILEPAPPSGIGALAVGAGALGIGTTNLVTMPICFVDLYPENAKNACIIASLVMAGAGVAVGVPSLILGLHRRARYKAWRARNRAFAPLEKLTVSPHARGAGLSFVTRF